MAASEGINAEYERAISREHAASGYESGFLTARELLFLTEPILERETTDGSRVSIFRDESTGVNTLLVNNAASGEDVVFDLGENDSPREVLWHHNPFIDRKRARMRRIAEIESYEAGIEQEEAATRATEARLKAERAHASSKSSSVPANGYQQAAD